MDGVNSCNTCTRISGIPGIPEYQNTITRIRKNNNNKSHPLIDATHTQPWLAGCYSSSIF